MVQVLAF